MVFQNLGSYCLIMSSELIQLDRFINAGTALPLPLDLLVDRLLDGSPLVWLDWCWPDSQHAAILSDYCQLMLELLDLFLALFGFFSGLVELRLQPCRSLGGLFGVFLRLLFGQLDF